MAAAIAAPSPAGSWRGLALAAAVAAGVLIGAVAARQLAPARAGVATFDARTFDRLPITNARFMPDGVTIVYSAASRGYTPELFVINPNAEAPQPLGFDECAPALGVEHRRARSGHRPRGTSTSASTAGRWRA